MGPTPRSAGTAEAGACARSPIIHCIALALSWYGAQTCVPLQRRLIYPRGRRTFSLVRDRCCILCLASMQSLTLSLYALRMRSRATTEADSSICRCVGLTVSFVIVSCGCIMHALTQHV
jgi:hypothetical protein